MALSKIQTFMQKLSESENVKKVLGDIQKLSGELQKKVQNINTNEAVRKYKEIVKKAAQAEGDLEKEVNNVIIKIKKSASEVKKDLATYKKKAIQQKNEFEKILKSKKAATKTSMKAETKSAAPAKTTAKAKKTATRSTKKKAVAKK